MATFVAENASVSPHAELEDDVYVGPFCVIGPHVRIGRGTRLECHVTLMGDCSIGEDNHVYPGTVIGGEPQDISYRGARTQVIIGDRNKIRESVTINRGSEKEDGITQLGNDCFLMAGTHVGHDCKVGHRVVIANASLLGGHVHIDHDVTISGSVGVHHYSSIGCYSFVGGLSRVLQDIPPYMLADGNPARPRCLNLVGLKRNEFSNELLKALAEAHRLIYRMKVGLDHAREILRDKQMLLPAVTHLLAFIQEQHEGRQGRSRERRRVA